MPLRSISKTLSGSSCPLSPVNLSAAEHSANHRQDGSSMIRPPGLERLDPVKILRFRGSFCLKTRKLLQPLYRQHSLALETYSFSAGTLNLGLNLCVCVAIKYGHPFVVNRDVFLKHAGDFNLRAGNGGRRCRVAAARSQKHDCRRTARTSRAAALKRELRISGAQRSYGHAWSWNADGPAQIFTAICGDELHGRGIAITSAETRVPCPKTVAWT
jgi:hypothetical protein